MKRAFVLISLLAAAPLLRGQDSTAAWRDELTENYKILKNTIADQKETIDLQRKAIEKLQGDISDLRKQLNKPPGNFASADDLQVLKDAIQDEAKKRQADEEKMLTEISKQIKGLAKITPAPVPGDGTGPAPRDGGSGGALTARPPHRTDHVDPPAVPGGNQPGFNYVVKDGDNPHKIARKLFEEKGIRINEDDILAANPGVKATELKVDQKLFIPLPKTDGAK